MQVVFLVFREKAFGCRKPTFAYAPFIHHLRRRIEAHVCIALTAYCIYLELEADLYISKSTFSLGRVDSTLFLLYENKKLQLKK
ncbi:MAG: hypothetical protein LBG45_08725 [Dysgonamonadaceae bacterium]|nr:hypothetical protein [Dysgonamonadaceae bacterium]